MAKDPYAYLKRHVMSKKKTPQPPKWATWFLHLYCRPDLLEDLEGDLTEIFQRNLQRHGASMADLGCGSGHDLVALALRHTGVSARLVGLDVTAASFQCHPVQLWR